MTVEIGENGIPIPIRKRLALESMSMTSYSRTNSKTCLRHPSQNGIFRFRPEVTEILSHKRPLKHTMVVFSSLVPLTLRSGLRNHVRSKLLIRPSRIILRTFSATPKEKKEDEPKPEESSVSTTNTTAAKQIDEDYQGKLYDNLPISFADISRAEVAIRGGVKRTLCEHSPFISELVGANVFFKPEFRQFTGSFKERGARNAILQLMRE